jgi:hypothetical protein
MVNKKNFMGLKLQAMYFATKHIFVRLTKHPLVITTTMI